MEIETLNITSKESRLELIVNHCMEDHDVDLLIKYLKQWKTIYQHYPELISRICADLYDITHEEFTSPSHERNIVDARKMFAYYFRIEKGSILMEIGKYIRKHHANIIFSVKEFQNLMERDQETLGLYLTLHARLEEYKEYL